jgi:hypothetical protein
MTTGPRAARRDVGRPAAEEAPQELVLAASRPAQIGSEEAKARPLPPSQPRLPRPSPVWRGLHVGRPQRGTDRDPVVPPRLLCRIPHHAGALPDWSMWRLGLLAREPAASALLRGIARSVPALIPSGWLTCVWLCMCLKQSRLTHMDDSCCAVYQVWDKFLTYADIKTWLTWVLESIIVVFPYNDFHLIVWPAWLSKFMFYPMV